MAIDDRKRTRLSVAGLVVLVLLSFSNLLTFGDRIASKPSQAGFWMIFAFGLCLGAAVIGIPVLLKKPRK